LSVAGPGAGARPGEDAHSFHGYEGSTNGFGIMGDHEA
jgi:hypothetical protein